MRCGRVRKKLMAYHDEELPRSERGRIEEHMNTCPRCSGMLEDLVRADSAAGPPGPGPQYWDSFTARVMASVKEEPIPARIGREKPQEKPGPAFLRFIPALSVALVFVVAVGLYFGGRVEFPVGSDMAPKNARKTRLKMPPPSARQYKLEMDMNVVQNKAPGEKAMDLEKKEAVQRVGQSPGIEERNGESEAPAPHSAEITISGEMAGEAYYKAKAAPGIPASALYARAKSSFRAGDFSRAEALLRMLLVEYPADPLGGKTSVLLARALDRQNRPNEAAMVLSEGERRFPGDADLARFRSEREALRLVNTPRK